MKKYLIVLTVVVVVGALFFFQRSSSAPKPVVGGPDEKNTSYDMEGQRVHLVDGVSTGESALTRYFGNPVDADLNGDGLQDRAFLLTVEAGGSGTFYYLVAAIKNANGYKGSNAMFIGDRIAPQSTEYRNGVITVNFATRAEDEPMTATPTVGASKSFIFVDGHFEDQVK